MSTRFVRTDNMAATKVPSLIKSAKYFNASDKASKVENGEIVAIGNLLPDEREVHKATTAETTDTYVGLVCTPELEYDEKGYHGIDTYNNAADQVIRVFILQKGDIFSIGNEGAAGADKSFESLTIKFIGTESVGRYSYNVYEVQ